MNAAAEPIVLSHEIVETYLHDREYKLNVLRLADRTTNAGLCTSLDTHDPVEHYLSQRLAKGKTAVAKITSAIQLGIVVPVWKEVSRLQPFHPVSNPNGEDALRCKVDALSWLFDGSKIEWTIYVVDDNCPEDSGAVAQSVVNSENYRNVKVLFLGRDFPYSREPLSRLVDLQKSVKGGAVIRGIQQAIDDGCDYVSYCDCDNSSYVGQVGQLLATAQAGNFDFVGGSRHLEKVILDWSLDRASEVDDGFKTIHYLRRFLKVQLPSNDTFGGFKLFSCSTLAKILPSMSIFDFAFDMDILGGLSSIQALSAQEPIISIDSHPASTWHFRGEHIVWYNKIRSLMAVADKYKLPYNRELARVINENITGPDVVQRLIKSPAPPKLKDVSRVDKREPGWMSVGEVEEFLNASLAANC